MYAYLMSCSVGVLGCTFWICYMKFNREMFVDNVFNSHIATRLKVVIIIVRNKS